MDAADKWMRDNGYEWGSNAEEIKVSKEKPKKCFHCGLGDFYWKKVKRQWVLVDENGKRHKCK